jgi:hypothetical protein
MLFRPFNFSNIFSEPGFLIDSTKGNFKNLKYRQKSGNHDTSGKSIKMLFAPKNRMVMGRKRGVMASCVQKRRNLICQVVPGTKLWENFSACRCFLAMAGFKKLSYL